MDSLDIILDYLNNCEKPVSASQIAVATGLERKDVDKVMTKLKKEGKIISPKVCFWELKDRI